MEITEIVELINKSMEEAQGNLTEKNIELTQAKVSLATTYDKNAGTGFKLLFFKVGGSVNFNNTNTVTYTFSKPEPKPSEEAGAYKFLDIKNDLTEAISKCSELYLDNPDIPNLKKESFTISLAFSITKKGDGSFEFELFDIIGGDVSGNYSVKHAHSITLTFGER